MLQTSDHVFWYISRLENQTEKLAWVSHHFCVKKASLFYQGGLLNTAEATAMFQKVWETWDHSTCWASIKQEPISKDLLIAGWRCMKTIWKLIFRLSFRVWILNMDAFLLLDNLNLRQQNNKVWIMKDLMFLQWWLSMNQSFAELSCLLRWTAGEAGFPVARSKLLGIWTGRWTWHWLTQFSWWVRW